ncbi:MAG: polysaccharide pyruvyl transferase family protein [Phycisphaerales bacterium]|nr:polysaccharide pyruvyl transferase family protein [Phycisphaerales bacterium]
MHSHDKKIGIATLRSQNYGAVLQGYALQKVLANFGYHAEFINYRPPKSSPPPSPPLSLHYRFARFFYWLFFHPSRLLPKSRMPSNNNVFQEFMDKYTNQSQKIDQYSQLEELSSDYVACIAGSDQIWNPNFAFHGFPFYTLSFIDKAKRISYAASFGVDEIPQSLRSHYERCLPEFVAISVREDKAAEIVHELTGHKVKVVFDPTLLLDQSAWNQLADKEKRKNSSNDSILCYCMENETGETLAVIRLAKELSRRMGGRPVLAFSTLNGGLPMNCCREMCQKEKVDFAGNVTPVDFVSLFANAAYIVSNSFHGTAFAIIYRKPFVTQLRSDTNKISSTNSRLTNITSLLGLSDRLLPFNTPPAERHLNLQLDYAHTEPILERMRQESLQYLQNALESVTKNQQQLGKNS